MPRVTLHTRSSRVTKRPYICTGCRSEIEPGQKYYEWERRYGGPQRRHETCGRPRPTELSSRKTAQVEEAILDAQSAIGSWDQQPLDGCTEPVESVELEYDDLTSALEAVAEVAREVASEYEDGVNNMPDALQYSPTGEAMTQVAEALNDWADEVEDFQPDAASVDLPDPDDYGSFDEWLEAAEQAVSEAVDSVREEAEGKLEDMPEYEG